MICFLQLCNNKARQFTKNEILELIILLISEDFSLEIVGYAFNTWILQVFISSFSISLLKQCSVINI